MNRLICTDLHLTDSHFDNYRWDFFHWIKNKVKENSVNRVYILGDITDRKDRHSSILVNKVVSALKDLAEVCEVIILQGNHDYDREKDNPFFRFTNTIENITFVYEPTVIGEELFIPHSYNDIIFNYISDKKNKYSFVYMHALLENYGSFSVEGISKQQLLKTGYNFISGDVHIPSDINDNRFIYVGAPYHIRFGDTYQGRVLLIDSKNSISSIEYKSVRKINFELVDSIDDFYEYNLNSDDQVSINLSLSPAYLDDRFNMIRDLKKYCYDNNIIIRAIKISRLSIKSNRKKLLVNKSDDNSIKSIFDSFCIKNSITGKLKKVGEEVCVLNK